MIRKENEETEARMAALRQKLAPKPEETEKAALDTVEKAIRNYLDRYNSAIYISEARECIEEMMEYLMCDNAAVFIRTHANFREVIRMKIRQFMRESPTPRLAFTLGMLQQKYFA